MALKNCSFPFFISLVGEASKTSVSASLFVMPAFCASLIADSSDFIFSSSPIMEATVSARIPLSSFVSGISDSATGVMVSGSASASDEGAFSSVSTMPSGSIDKCGIRIVALLTGCGSGFFGTSGTACAGASCPLSTAESISSSLASFCFAEARFFFSASSRLISSICFCSMLFIFSNILDASCVFTVSISSFTLISGECSSTGASGASA